MKHKIIIFSCVSIFVVLMLVSSATGVLLTKNHNIYLPTGIFSPDPDGPRSGGMDDPSDLKHWFLCLFFGIGNLMTVGGSSFAERWMRDHSDEAFDREDWAGWDS